MYSKPAIVQNLKTIVSKTRTGPVDPKIVSGCPEKKPYPMPQIKPDTSDSMAAILFPVTPPNSPPNVIIGERQAKYRNIQEATHCRFNASLKSDLYHGDFRFRSFFSPPNSWPVRDKPDWWRSFSSSSSSALIFSCLFGFSGGRLRRSCDGIAAGGSIRILGSHSPGGRTVRASKNSSRPASRCSRFRARYATTWNISSDKRVAMDRPISWKLVSLSGGPNSMNRNLKRNARMSNLIDLSTKYFSVRIYLVGTGTSVKSPIIAASFNLINALSVLSKNSTSPTKMLLASAPGGIFFIKCVFPLCDSYPFDCSSAELWLRCIDWVLGLVTISSPLTYSSIKS